MTEYVNIKQQEKCPVYYKFTTIYNTYMYYNFVATTIQFSWTCHFCCLLAMTRNGGWVWGVVCCAGNMC